MAFDPLTGYVVLFGGIIDMTTNPNTTLSDTWIFENSEWKHLNATGPCARLGEYMAYDYTDNYILMFGGGPYLTLNSSLYYSDTWEFQNGTWTKLFPATSPNARGLGAITWDPIDDYLLVYGGMSSETDIHNDTWTYSYGHWHNLTLSVHPRQLLSPVMAYDPAEHYVLLYGGATPCPDLEFGNDLQETWSYAHGIWTNLTSKVRGQVPDGRILSSMAYDPAQGYMVLFGGWNTTQGVVYGDTWIYTNGFWARLFVSPVPASAIIGADLISTTSSAGLLLFGGIVGSLSNYEATNATWAFGPLPPNVRPAPFTVSFKVAPSGCSGVDFNGSNEASGLSTTILPGAYNITAETCAGYTFGGWFQTGGVYVTSQVNVSTTVDVTGNGSLTAYYQPVNSAGTPFYQSGGSSNFAVNTMNMALAVVGVGALVFTIVWGYPRILRRSRLRRTVT
jgi:uncharacterized repeat protein (TIGR02543 family)